MLFFSYKNLKKRLSVLLIVTLIFGMTANHFAITDIEVQESSTESYHESITENSDESITESSDEGETEEVVEKSSVSDAEEYVSCDIDSCDEDIPDEVIYSEEPEEEIENEIEATESDIEQEEIEEIIEEIEATESEIEEIFDASVSEAEDTIDQMLLFSTSATHTHDGVDYRAITDESDLYSDTSSYVYLANDIVLNNAVNLSYFTNEELYICLNGKVLEYENDTTIFDVSDGKSLCICDYHPASVGNVISTSSTICEDPFIKVSGTGQVKIENISFKELDVNGSIVEVVNGGNVVISDTTIDDSSFVKPMMYVHGVDAKLSFKNENQMRNNAVESDSMLFADDGGTIELLSSSETLCESNSVNVGGVVHLENYAKFSMQGDLIASYNNAEKGGFAYIDNTAIFESDSDTITIENCSANYGGGLYINIKNNERFIDDNITYNIKENTAHIAGGGIYLYFDCDTSFSPESFGKFNFYNNTAKQGAGLFISGAEGKKGHISKLFFDCHTLGVNESLIETDIDAVIDNVKIESINEIGDSLGQLISNGTLIRVRANNNDVTISNILLYNDTDKLNRAYKGIELKKDPDKTIKLTVSTYSMPDKIAFGIDISNIQNDNVSKVILNNVYSNYTNDCSSFYVPLAEDFPKPDNFYTALSALTGNGSKALSLDYIPNFTTRWEVAYRFGSSKKSIGAMPFWHGTGYSSGYNVTGTFGFVAKDSSHIQCGFGAVANSYWYQVPVGSWYTMYIDAYNRKASNGRDVISGNGRGMNFNNPGSFKYGVSPLYIFGASANGGGTRNVHAGSTKWSKIYENGVLIRDFIPITLTKDIPGSMDRYGISRKTGSQGLWDRINEEFYEYISGTATSETTEVGVCIYHSTIPVEINNLSMIDNPKRCVYIENSENIDFKNTSIENTNAPVAMTSPYIQILDNSKVSFSDSLDVKNNTIQKNSIFDIKDDSTVILKDEVDIVNNSCVSTTEKMSSVICVERGAKLYIKTEDVDILDNKTKKGVIGLYETSKMYIRGHLVVKDNYVYADESKTLNIYIKDADACISYDEDTNVPIKPTSKISITSGALDSAVFKNWNATAIEKFNDGTDISKAIYLPDDIFIPDTAHQTSNQLLYKKGIYPNTDLCIGANFAKLEYKKNEDIIGIQRVAKNTETTIDSIYLVGTPADLQTWEGPTLTNENENECWGITDTTKTVKITSDKIVKMGTHEHLLCGDTIADSCAHGEYKSNCIFMYVQNDNDFVYKFNKYKKVFLTKDTYVKDSVTFVDNDIYAICLNGHKLILANGKNIFNVQTGKKLIICNCKVDGFVTISTVSQLGSNASINVNNTDFAMTNVKVESLDNNKVSLLSMNGNTSKLYLSDIEFTNNSLMSGNLLNVNNINVATFNNIKVNANIFRGSSTLLSISSTDVYINGTEIFENTIKENMITAKNVRNHVSSAGEYKVHDNVSSGSIITVGGNINLMGEKTNNTTEKAVYYTTNGVTDIIATDLTINTNTRALYIGDGNVTLSDINIINCGDSTIDGGAIYINKGTLIFDDDINIDGNANAIYNAGGKLYLMDPADTTTPSNIKIKNGTGTYVLSADTANGAEYYLLSGKIYQNNTDNVYIKTTSATSDKNNMFYIGGDFKIEVESGKKGIHVTDQNHEIFKEHNSVKMTNDNRLSYYVDENAVRIFSSFINNDVDKDTVFIIEDANRDPERPMYIDQYEDTKDLYIYYKSIVLDYKYKFEGKNTLYNLNLQSNPDLPRRVMYNSPDSVVIGHPTLGIHEFRGWDGPDIASPNTLDDIVLTNITDMATRSYIAYFRYVYTPGEPSKSSGGGNSGGNAPSNNIPLQSEAKLIPPRGADTIVLPGTCEWIYNPIRNEWSLNIKTDKEKVRAANGFYDVCSYDEKGNMISDVYHFDEQGKMITGWVKDLEGSMYFFNADKGNDIGKMITGWKEIGASTWYYFNENGKLAVNTLTPDGRQVGADGSWKAPSLNVIYTNVDLNKGPGVEK